MVRSLLALGLALFLVAAGMAQTWKTAYEAGLAQAQQGNWTQARASFKAAAENRPDDRSGSTSMPGPATQQRVWREGAPYSPNFLAAYSAYRVGISNGENSAAALQTAAEEFEALIAREQYSREVFFFLNDIYNKLDNREAKQRLETIFGTVGGKLNWRVDAEPLSPEERATIALSYRSNTTTTVVRPSDLTGGGGTTPIRPGGGFNPTNQPIIAPPVGRVPIVSDKYALLIGNSETQIPGAAIPHAVDDVALIRQALIEHAGYDENNIVTLTNVTAEQMMTAARELSSRVSEGSPVFIFFAGAGYNLDGKDYLAGTNTSLTTDTSTMAPKFDLFLNFISKGAYVFSFFEVHRPVINGSAFGMEIPVLGVSSQTFATLRGEQVYPTMRQGKTVGTYVDAFASTLQELRSNRVPILEFGWQVFYNMRRGDTGTRGGGGRQTPTLPILSNMASNARF